MIDKDKLPKTFEEALKYPILNLTSIGDELVLEILIQVNPTVTINVTVPVPTNGHPVGRLENYDGRGFEDD